MTRDAFNQIVMIGYQGGSACVVINGNAYDPAALAQEFRYKGRDAQDPVLAQAQTGLASFIALNGRYSESDFLMDIGDARRAGFHIK